MKREVVTCDASGCRKLADVACILCKADYCFEHMPIRLVLRFGTVSPKKPENPTQPQFSEFDEGVGESICHACSTFFASTNSDVGIHGAARVARACAFTGRLGAVYAQLVEDVHAMRAAHALGARGEELLKAGAAAAQTSEKGPPIFILAKEGSTAYWQLSADGAFANLARNPTVIKYPSSWPGLPHGWLEGTYIVHHAGDLVCVTTHVIVSREDGLAVCPPYLRDRYRAIAEGRA